MAYVNIDIEPQLYGVLIKDEAQKKQYLETLRLARYGTDAERAEYSARWQASGAGPYLLELVAGEYVNAIWFLYHYYANKVSGYDEFAAKYANIDSLHDRTAGNLTVSDVSTASTTTSSHSSSSQLRSWVKNILIIGDPIAVLNSGDPNFLPTVAQMYKEGDSDVVESLTDWYPELKPIVESYIANNSTTSHSSSHVSSSATTVVTTDQNTGDTVIIQNDGRTSTGLTRENNYGGNPYYVVKTHSGVTGYKATSQNPNAGSWSFTFNNGETFTTSDYNEALLIEAALWYEGKGPRPGAQSWSYSDGRTFYNYSDAWQAYQQDLADTLQRLASGEAAQQYSAAQNSNMNESALLSMSQQGGNGTGTGTGVKTTPLNTSAAKKSSLKWWIIGGAGVLLVSGLIFYYVRKKQRR